MFEKLGEPYDEEWRILCYAFSFLSPTTAVMFEPICLMFLWLFQVDESQEDSPYMCRFLRYTNAIAKFPEASVLRGARKVFINMSKKQGFEHHFFLVEII